MSGFRQRIELQFRQLTGLSIALDSIVLLLAWTFPPQTPYRPLPSPN
jgi:hypothetical protein